MNRMSGLKRDLVEAAEHLSRLGYLAADSGFMSVRADQTIIYTPPRVHRARLDPRQLETVRLDGKGKREIPPGSDLWTHLVIYRERADVNGVIFAQPPTATGMGIAGEALEARVLPEIVATLGAVPLLKREGQFGEEKTEFGAVTKHLDSSQAFLLANRGAVTIGEDIWEAASRMELVEHYARVLWTARLLGRVETLTDKQVARLVEVHFEQEGGRNL